MSSSERTKLGLPDGARACGGVSGATPWYRGHWNPAPDAMTPTSQSVCRSRYSVPSSHHLFSVALHFSSVPPTLCRGPLRLQCACLTVQQGMAIAGIRAWVGCADPWGCWCGLGPKGSQATFMQWSCRVLPLLCDVPTHAILEGKRHVENFRLHANSVSCRSLSFFLFFFFCNFSLSVGHADRYPRMLTGTKTVLW